MILVPILTSTLPLPHLRNSSTFHSTLLLLNLSNIIHSIPYTSNSSIINVVMYNKRIKHSCKNKEDSLCLRLCHSKKGHNQHRQCNINSYHLNLLHSLPPSKLLGLPNTKVRLNLNISPRNLAAFSRL